MKNKIHPSDYIKASRKGSREAEIEMYGHPIHHERVFVSKKKYNRKDKSWKTPERGFLFSAVHD